MDGVAEQENGRRHTMERRWRGYYVVVLWVCAACGSTDVRPTCEAVRLETTSLNPRVGDAAHVGARGVTKGGVTTEGSAFTWLSSDPTVALVDQRGQVTPLRPGTTTITVTCTNAAIGRPSAAVQITVRPPLVRLLIQRAGAGNGFITTVPAGNDHEDGTSVVITATPAEGSVLQGFTGPCVRNGNTCTVVMRYPGPMQITVDFSLCPTSYCGEISITGGTLNFQRAGFGFNWDGHFEYAFDPAPRAGIRIHNRLNASSVSGSATTTGASTLSIPLSGSTIACLFVNPSTMVLTDLDRPIPALKIITFTWDRSGCSTAMRAEGSALPDTIGG
ncbi:MAG: Ig-like domain-containing protein [Gemmatimonadetes bacterium]|nr:Ig-like domain-containing protein [Gemmatimonadota bacterium]